jgi:flagellar biosynthesis/type III secretory pathway protein FliH
LRIYVHPEDALALPPHWAHQQATFSGQKIELIPSDIIKRGGCFIEGQYGSVDARIETQLQMTKDTLMNTLALPVGHQE